MPPPSTWRRATRWPARSIPGTCPTRRGRLSSHAGQTLPGHPNPRLRRRRLSKSARAVAAAVSGGFVVPRFPSERNGQTDFNDPGNFPGAGFSAVNRLALRESPQGVDSETRTGFSKLFVSLIREHERRAAGRRDGTRQSAIPSGSTGAHHPKIQTHLSTTGNHSPIYTNHNRRTLPCAAHHRRSGVRSGQT